MDVEPHCSHVYSTAHEIPSVGDGAPPERDAPAVGKLERVDATQSLRAPIHIRCARRLSNCRVFLVGIKDPIEVAGGQSALIPTNNVRCLEAWVILEQRTADLMAPGQGPEAVIHTNCDDPLVRVAVGHDRHRQLDVLPIAGQVERDLLNGPAGGDDQIDRMRTRSSVCRASLSSSGPSE